MFLQGIEDHLENRMSLLLPLALNMEKWDTSSQIVVTQTKAKSGKKE